MQQSPYGNGRSTKGPALAWTESKHLVQGWSVQYAQWLPLFEGY